MKPQINLLLDSGAFSAFTRQKVIDIDKYIEFIKKYESVIYRSINLDVIMPSDPEQAAELGRKNFLYMRDKGVNPIPVYHAREHTRWLDYMLDETDYIGLSGTSLVSPLESAAWHELIWAYLTDSGGRAFVKTHAFGDTAPQSLLSFPWVSCDSATWMIQAGRAARIKLQGKSYQIRSTMLRDANYVDVNDPGPKKEAWENEIRQLGVDPEKFMKADGTQSEIAMMRSYLVASNLLKLQQETRGVTKFKKQASLLAEFGKQYTRDGRVPDGTERDGPVQLFMAISPSAYFFNLPICYALGIKNLLVSYHYIRTAPPQFMEERLMPFLYNPKEACESHPKLKKYLDKLREVMVNPI